MKTILQQVTSSANGLLRQLGIVVFGLIALTTLALVAPQRVSASGTCWANSLCMWEHANEGGAQIMYYNPIRGQCYDLPTNWWDRVSSYWNRTSISTNLYTLDSCNGFNTNAGVNEYIGTLWGSGYNDEIRSFCPGC